MMCTQLTYIDTGGRCLRAAEGLWREIDTAILPLVAKGTLLCPQGAS